MQLSEHDLRQLDDAYLRSLPAEVLRALSSKLLSALKEARDRLNRNPSNSSRPPSTRDPWEKGEKPSQNGTVNDDVPRDVASDADADDIADRTHEDPAGKGPQD